jgi:hypothetical protein
VTRRLLAVAMGLLLGACTSGGGGSVPAASPVSLPQAADGSEVTVAKEKPPLLPEDVDMLAEPIGRYLSVWERPNARHPEFALDTRNPVGRISPMLIAGAKRSAGGAWYEVYLPLRPNGSTGWVRLEDVQLRRVDERIEIDLSDRLLRHFVGDRLEDRFSVGIGTDSTPTGRGTFYVWVKVRYASPYQPYGIAALGLSGFSPVLSDWPGGGRMAIHGTSSPTDRGRKVSHGCVRVYNEDLKSLLDVPLGTPVVISA